MEFICWKDKIQVIRRPYGVKVLAIVLRAVHILYVYLFDGISTFTPTKYLLAEILCYFPITFAVYIFFFLRSHSLPVSLLRIFLPLKYKCIHRHTVK